MELPTISKSQDFYQILIEAIQDVVYVVTPEMKVEYVNSNGAKLLNRPTTEIVGKHLGTLFPPETAQRQMSNIKKVIDTGQPRFVEHPYPFPGGERWLNARLFPLKDAEGTTTAVLGTSLDITDKKATEQALEESQKIILEEREKQLQLVDKKLSASEERYRKLVEICPDMVAVIVDGKLEYVNPAFVRSFGGTNASQFTGKQFEQFIHQDYRKKIQKRIAMQIKTGQPVSISEMKYKRLDGTIMTGESASAPFIFQGRPAIQKVIRDVTDRKIAEMEQQKLVEIVNHSKELISLATMDGHIIFLNEAGGKILGIDPQACRSYHIMDFIPEHLAKIIEIEILPTLRRGETWEGDLQYRNLRNENITDVHTNAFIVGNPVTEESWFLANVSLDITERMKAEENRLALEKKILQTQKLESLGVLAGGIAHDFNNLLMGVLGNAEMALLSLKHDSLQRSYLQDIQTASIRLTELTNQMLAYSGKGKFVVKLFDLSSLVEEMIQLLKISMTKKVELNLQLGNNLPPVKGDASQVRQVIMNLITNASEACGDQNGTISIITGVQRVDPSSLTEYFQFEELPARDYVYLEVTDTGCGMDEETCQKIFEPFFSTKFAGRGLGMAAVMGIIRSHRGAIKVCSEQEQGTIIKILFPYVEEKKGEQSQEAVLNEYLSIYGQGLVLLVDDEEAVRTVGRRMLEHMGFSVLSAVDGEEAIEMVHNHADELICVLLDFTMPKMDGLEAFTKIQEIRPDLPVILCSGYKQHDIASHFKDKRQVYFLQKPYRYRDIADKLHEILKS